jgi:dienelactone hydrolase
MAGMEQYLKTLKQEKSIERIGAVGFCYGGKFAVDFNTKGLVDATVACHPSFTNLASYENLKAPILFNCAETDDIFPESLRKQVQEKLDSNSSAPAHDFKVFEK